ncbi:MAG: hypothetical protein AAFX02_07560 [Pseudomonadota bacterium]
MSDAQTERADEDRRQYEDDLKKLMGQKAFRRFAWQLLSQCQMFSSSMTGNAWTQFREGMRNVGISLTRDMHIAPDLYMEMWRENALRSDFKALNENGKPEIFEYE